MYTDFWYEIYESIKRNPSRAILTSIGIAWGIFILILLVGVGRGFEKGIFKLFEGFSKSTTYVYASETSIGYKGTHIGRKIRFSENNLQMLKLKMPEFLLISPEVSELNIVYKDTKAGKFEIRGVYPDYFKIKLLKPDRGRVLNYLDMSERRKIALIGKNVAKILFKNEQPVGKQIKIDQETYLVAGVIKNTILNTSEEQIIYVPYSTYLESNATFKEFTTILFTNGSKIGAKKTNEHMRQLMAQEHQFDPRDEKVLYFNSMEEQTEAFTNLFSTIKKFLWFMGISTLISGVIGVGNIMYSTAKERTREIGIRKSVGANSNSIKAMFLWEAIVLTSISGYIGIILGWIVLRIIGLFISNENTLIEKLGIDGPTTIAAILILIIGGIIAGLKPAMYAAELNPIEALKSEN